MFVKSSVYHLSADIQFLHLQHAFIESLLIMFCGVSFDIGSSIWIDDIQRLCKSYTGNYMALKRSLQGGSFAPIMFEEILAVL